MSILIFSSAWLSGDSSSCKPSNARLQAALQAKHCYAMCERFNQTRTVSCVWPSTLIEVNRQAVSIFTVIDASFSTVLGTGAAIVFMLQVNDVIRHQRCCWSVRQHKGNSNCGYSVLSCLLCAVLSPCNHWVWLSGFEEQRLSCVSFQLLSLIIPDSFVVEDCRAYLFVGVQNIIAYNNIADVIVMGVSLTGFCAHIEDGQIN